METTNKIYVIANKEYQAATLEEARALHKKATGTKSAQDLYNECKAKLQEIYDWTFEQENPTVEYQDYSRYNVDVKDREIETFEKLDWTDRDIKFKLFYVYKTSTYPSGKYRTYMTDNEAYLMRNHTQRRLSSYVSTIYVNGYGDGEITPEMRDVNEGFRIINADTKEEYQEWLNNFDTHFEKYKKFVNALIENNKLFVERYQKEKQDELINDLKEHKEGIIRLNKIMKEHNII